MPDVVFRRRATFERGYAQVRVLGGLDRHGEGRPPSAERRTLPITSRQLGR